jgi:DNA-binding transcriptional LysR family regulator
MIARHVGIGVLPCFMAETAPELVRVLPEVSITGAFWLSARRDILQTARVRQVKNWIYETVSAQRKILLPD